MILVLALDVWGHASAQVEPVSKAEGMIPARQCSILCGIL
jgi:hypothetical protein